MRHSLTVNGTDAYTAAALAGLGLIQAPARGLRRLVDAGLLVEVLPAFTAPPLPVTVLYAHRRHLPPRVAAFMQWLAELLPREAAT
jgi:DNA-binding transcriptional LysR family regulator